MGSGVTSDELVVYDLNKAQNNHSDSELAAVAQSRQSGHGKNHQINDANGNGARGSQGGLPV